MFSLPHILKGLGVVLCNASIVLMVMNLFFVQCSLQEVMILIIVLLIGLILLLFSKGLEDSRRGR